LSINLRPDQPAAKALWHYKATVPLDLTHQNFRDWCVTYNVRVNGDPNPGAKTDAGGYEFTDSPSPSWLVARNTSGLA
jgi:hypothetical protein